MSGVASHAAARVLVVEDEELVALSLAKLLRLNGFEPEVVATVSGAIDALDSAAGSRPFEHVILDLKLLDGDGEAVLSHAEHMPQRPNVIVVAAPERLDGHRILSIRGRCEFLPKPVMFEALMVMLDRPKNGALSCYARAFGFSEQERAVFDNALQGLDDETIALRIGCSRSTVKSYWMRLCGKISRKRRDQALAHFGSWVTQQSSASGVYRVASAPSKRPPKVNKQR